MSDPETGPEWFSAPTEVLPAAGRHASPQGPTTGPFLRIGLPPGGRHQEDDLDPKRWPWLVLVTVCTALAVVTGFTWGQGTGKAAAREELTSAVVFTPEPEPLPAVTVTETAPARPRPTRTVTAPARPRATVTVTSAPAPGPTVYRTAPASPRPRPTVTRTRTVEVRACFTVELDELEEIECP